ncbi:MAG: hypothetical protein B6I17_03705 [Tenericutes bacterium 4572_104]|nr:MAG: hypothetical protein B6I17_03705 [Tenericutes bacterium 4572_104]
MPYYIWILLTVIFILVILFWGGSFIALGIIKPNRRSLLDTSSLEEEKYPGIMNFYRENLKNKYEIKSRYNYNLAVYYLENKSPSNRFIVMSHGHTYTHHGCLKYARMMMRYGYNIILYDQRYHGDSGGKFTTLGWYEKDDLYDVITDTINRYGKDITIGLYGESMGSATVLLEASIDKRVQFVFSDCGFSNLEELVREILYVKTKPYVRIFLPFGKIMFRIFTKVKMSRISPIDALNTISLPIFFAHGKADNFISYTHTQKMYDSYNGPKQIFIALNNSLHAEGYLKDEFNYEAAVKEFYEKFIKNE